MNDQEPRPAAVSFCIALIPEEPLYSQVAAASLAIASEHENHNVIDNSRFPAHLSLLLSGASSRGIQAVREELSPSICRGCAEIVTAVYEGSRGFIGLTVDGTISRRIHEHVLQVAATLQSREPVVRPHLLQRWKQMTAEQQSAVRLYGSYKVKSAFVPHFSIAAVAAEHQADMAKMARQHIDLPQTVRFREMQLVDVGPENERWHVLERFPL